MITLGKWLVPDMHTRPCVYDVDCRAVDAESVPNWANVRQRFLNLHDGNHNSLLDITPSSAMTYHPVSRHAVKGVNQCNFTGFHALPMWIQERIAVLNIAPADTIINDIGKRWGVKSSTGLIPNAEKRFYTLLWWPRSEGHTVTWHFNTVTIVDALGNGDQWTSTARQP